MAYPRQRLTELGVNLPKQHKGKVQISLRLDAGLLTELDQLIPHHKRTKFVQALLSREINLMKMELESVS
jgi:hypothetical protein